MTVTIVDAPRPVTGGVHTHLDLNVAAALDEQLSNPVDRGRSGCPWPVVEDCEVLVSETGRNVGVLGIDDHMHAPGDVQL
jgi:hypothetical protein